MRPRIKREDKEILTHLPFIHNRPMYRLLIILISFLFTVHTVCASVAIPYVFVKNYTVDDYKASCQNWGFSLTPDGMLYVANNSGLLAFDGNTWRLYSLPGQEEVTGVTNYNDTIYTRNETMLGSWTYDKDGTLRYRPLNMVPPEVRFTPPAVETPFTLPKEIQDAQPSAFATNGTLFFIGTLTQGLYITDSDGTILQHLSLQNQLQDNIVRFICVQDTRQIWVALDNGLSQISFDPPITLLGKRSAIGKLANAGLDGEELYIQTNLGYFKRSLGATSPFVPVNEAEAQPYLKTDKAPVPDVKQLFRNTEALGIFAQAGLVYPAGDDLYWLSIGNEAGLFHVADGIGTLKCRLLFDNYNMNLVTRGKRIIPLNDSLVLVSAMQGALLINIRELIGNSLGSTPLKISGLEYVDASGIHRLPINTQHISLPHDFQEFNVWAGTTIFTSNHQISYKIEGVSSDWSAWQHDGKITFLQLPEGRYELKVRKYVIKGPYPELTLPIEVRPPWYNTVWAWLVYIALVWFLVQAVLRYNLRNLHKEEQEKAEAERQAEQQQMQLIKNQMLEAELQNKNNELTLQTTALVKRNQAVQSLLEELEKQKETLGERYPNKLYIRMKTLMEETLNNQADWVLFESYFNSTHQTFMDRLRQRYSDLTTGDLRICCLLRMNLSTKEIASLMNVSVRAIELRRYRLRKRLELEGDTNLVDFLMGF